MTSFIELAKLLESAAAALREAAKHLEKVRTVDHDQLLSSLRGFMDLDVRTRMCLRRESDYQGAITTVGQLLAQSSEELLSRRNFGRTSLQAVRGLLDSHGLKLRLD